MAENQKQERNRELAKLYFEAHKQLMTISLTVPTVVVLLNRDLLALSSTTVRVVLGLFGLGAVLSLSGLQTAWRSLRATHSNEPRSTALIVLLIAAGSLFVGGLLGLFGVVLLY